MNSSGLTSAFLSPLNAADCGAAGPTVCEDGSGRPRSDESRLRCNQMSGPQVCRPAGAPRPASNRRRHMNVNRTRALAVGLPAAVVIAGAGIGFALAAGGPAGPAASHSTAADRTAAKPSPPTATESPAGMPTPSPPGPRPVRSRRPIGPRPVRSPAPAATGARPVPSTRPTEPRPVPSPTPTEGRCRQRRHRTTAGTVTDTGPAMVTMTPGCRHRHPRSGIRAAGNREDRTAAPPDQRARRRLRPAPSRPRFRCTLEC